MQVFDHRLLVAVPANKWIGEWVQRDPSPIYRPTLAAQLRLIRKRHGTPYAKEYRDHMVWMGSYPPKYKG